MRRKSILPFMPHANPPRSIDDYLSLVDDEHRTELLDGEFVVSPTPSLRHQRAVLLLAMILETQVSRLGLGLVCIAPLDVILSPNTAAHPDVLFVSTANLGRVNRLVEGPPDLAVEFLSPSNPENDLVRKMTLYLKFGVPEYWIGDVEAKTIRVLENAGSAWRELGTFKPGDKITSARMPGVIVPVSEVYEVKA